MYFYLLKMLRVRRILLSVGFVQFITILERQVFDFLGYLWTPILLNFFHIIFVIFGFYGAYYSIHKYILAHKLWNWLWICWNIFLICFYLEIGSLQPSGILNLGTGSNSWFELNGYGCKPIYSPSTISDPHYPIRPVEVIGCLVDYFIIEILHSAIQIVLSILFLLGVISFFVQRQWHKSVKTNTTFELCHPSCLSEYAAGGSTPNNRSAALPQFNCDNLYSNESTSVDFQQSPKPMTPRKVKRRSVMTRESSIRENTLNRRSSRNSRKNAGHSKKKSQNYQSKTKKLNPRGSQMCGSTFHADQSVFMSPNLNSVMQDTIDGANEKANEQTFNLSHSDQCYNNVKDIKEERLDLFSKPNQGCHSNPCYQQSVSNLSYKIEIPEAACAIRPASARSNYSNFHGTRPFASHSIFTTNCFNNLSKDITQPSEVQGSTNLPFDSVRSMTFLNSGPPAYNFNYHTPPDSETTM